MEANQALVTGGAICRPEHRKYPRCINPLERLATQQEEVWDRISKSPVSSEQNLNSIRVIDRVQVLVHVSSEDNDRIIEQDLVEIPAEEVLNTTHSDEQLRHDIKSQERLFPWAT